jgi:hypothetical protein
VAVVGSAHCLDSYQQSPRGPTRFDFEPNKPNISLLNMSPNHPPSRFLRRPLVAPPLYGDETHRGVTTTTLRFTASPVPGTTGGSGLLPKARSRGRSVAPARLPEGGG